MTTFLLIIGGLILLVAFFGVRQRDQVNKDKAAQGLIDTGRYVAGHPLLNNPCHQTSIAVEEAALQIYVQETITAQPVAMATIPRRGIQRVTIQDKTAIEHNVTLARFVLTGVFAFLWKKREERPLAALQIQWHDGQADHDTYFLFDGPDAMTRANTARNRLLSV